ncbi:non-hydrolyzing UDP-N-acetylglucosamine 2-epimerase [Thermofilum sp.]|uniref:non-hydrolyzing UDP-N-acetylglucosamine 2-epimerase n=1 Tax=Thermofilum sp. TaxID=1961369 RepID=UPI0031626A1A
MKVSIVVGTRPEIIKMSPVIRECERLKLNYFIVHTGQHYSFNMSGVFFEQLELPKPKYNLRVGSGSHAEQTAKMLMGVEKVLRLERPNIVLVQGDTNTALAGALAAAKLRIKIGHVEAGLRSHDRQMPEEVNRVLIDHCSDLLFAPTEGARRNLLGEGISAEKVFTVGNTIVDAVYQNLEIARKRGCCPVEGDYFLATVHRQENVVDRRRLRGILKGLEMVAERYGAPVIFPAHPRTRRVMESLGIRANGLEVIEPLDYHNFLMLESRARLILTDSGGIQEEACILGVPCVTLRYNTERPETLEVGSNILAGTDPNEIVEKAGIMLERDRNWRNPYGDGTAGRKIVGIVLGGAV